MGQIQISNVFKIFGPKPHNAIELVRRGVSKDDLLNETGHTIGVQDVTLTVEPGQCTVVMGLSGSGKSTLIRHINRLIEPTAGEIIVEGQDILALKGRELEDFRRRMMSMVFQRFGLFPHKTVIDNVAYGLDIKGGSRVEKRANRETARHWIGQVGLTGYEDQFPSQLSGGMQQRVGLARALATDADILLMDEAFSALDPLIRREMQDQLIELQDTLHKTIVFITHDLDEALRLGDTIAIMKDGAIEQIGTGEEILQRPQTEYVRRFVEDVNRGRVLTAGTVKLECAIAKVDATPGEALRQLGEGGLRVTYVVDADGRLVGAVTAASLRRGQRDNVGTVDSLVEDVPTATEDMVLEEVLPMTVGEDIPVAVLNDAGELRGILPKDTIIRALAEEAQLTAEAER
ncbi:MAG: glycine betaine/L-proline ABC transporter ATP-binding protein [Rhodospirillaceae bacterium]|nr:glycine betaine/L-proline ABC transporter ATP-binding protein [Rhodospirillaceae bacterium]MDE0617785.1 glycine betaine/L-proline ABC transporter ATP-binding protein [Rhodospirillaceae bacterium]MXY39522.1 glycine betaine/L-proline ABC transporter ATP-binding protein [Rhodospirillaceae bacterium]MYF86776.1 glycine betaine/L-proline ABC transporter ATP-binding protein [Rhodospirillaceae bacterium]MYH36983.1 glycine betaine/L-proline ABC transporter ATP-binding protein [Rhodospirillaceae bacte